MNVSWALDIGGTTAKASLVERGKVRVASDYFIERTPTTAGYPIKIPVVDIVEYSPAPTSATVPLARVVILPRLIRSRPERLPLRPETWVMKFPREFGL